MAAHPFTQNSRSPRYSKASYLWSSHRGLNCTEWASLGLTSITRSLAETLTMSSEWGIFLLPVLGDTRGTSHSGAGLLFQHYSCEIPYSSHSGVPAAHPPSLLSNICTSSSLLLLRQYSMAGITPSIFHLLKSYLLLKASPTEPFLYAVPQADNHSLMTGTRLNSILWHLCDDSCGKLSRECREVPHHCRY